MFLVDRLDRAHSGHSGNSKHDDFVHPQPGGLVLIAAVARLVSAKTHSRSSVCLVAPSRLLTCTTSAHRRLIDGVSAPGCV